ncbi:MAG: PilZ domain-containing protein [Elusimicrobia bacterium]|nr:PilZ domain-containing protein [Elusimicrobiota bacterium]
MTKTMKEKRKHPRFPVGITMDIRAHGQTVDTCRGSIMDLSVGGMAFKTNAALEQGMTIYLKINIPLEIRGEVRHSKGSLTGGMHRYGVRFHKIGFMTPDTNKPEHFIAAKFQK